MFFSDRETAILGQLAAGLTNREIARELGISEATVYASVTRLCQKLGVEDRADAARWARNNVAVGK